jgi:hypothetical protein
MTAQLWVSILIFTGTAVVSLIIASLHRRQMRQIELHRGDPSVPITPPPHAVTQFLKRHGFPLLGIGISAFYLVHDLRAAGPVTRGDVFSIALNTSVIFYWLSMESLRFLDVSIMRMMEGHRRVIDALSGNVTKIIEVISGERLRK